MKKTTQLVNSLVRLRDTESTDASLKTKPTARTVIRNRGRPRPRLLRKHAIYNGIKEGSVRPREKRLKPHRTCRSSCTFTLLATSFRAQTCWITRTRRSSRPVFADLPPTGLEERLRLQVGNRAEGSLKDTSAAFCFDPLFLKTS